MYISATYFMNAKFVKDLYLIRRKVYNFLARKLEPIFQYKVKREIFDVKRKDAGNNNIATKSVLQKRKTHNILYIYIK